MSELLYRQSPPKRFEMGALVPALAAMAWVLGGTGWKWWLLAIWPAALATTAAVALLAKIHEQRIHQIHAFGGLLGAALALPSLLIGGGWPALLAGGLSLWSFCLAGRIALSYEPHYLGAEPPLARLDVDAKAALDESLMSVFVAIAKIPAGHGAEVMCLQAKRLEAAMDEQGWINHPASFHLAPLAPNATTRSLHRWRGIDYEKLRFSSGFTPHAQLPGAANYASYAANQQACIRVLKHPGAARPWLMCVHGYRMGIDRMDLGLFNPGYLHKKLGFNLLLPVLPLHGPRKVGRLSGDEYLDGNVLELLHAQAHALWDLRRSLAWLRDQETSPQIGVYGISLGGFNAALLAGYEAQLDFVVAGIPLADPARALWRFLPEVHRRFYHQNGMSEARFARILTPVSPLALPPKIAAERLHIFAAAADRIVTPDHPVKLGKHWQAPVQWYQGSHLGISAERLPRQVLAAAFSQAGWR